MSYPSLKVVSEPEDWPITLEDAKRHLRIDEDDTDYDEEIEMLIEAAVSYVDGPNGFLGRALVEQTWDAFFDCWPSANYFEIPLPPLIEVEGVYYNSGNGEIELNNYSVDDASQPARIYLSMNASWPTLPVNSRSAIRVRFRAGYLDKSSPPLMNVPFAIRSAILLYIGDLFTHKENQVVGQAVSKLPWASEQLLRPHRVFLSLA